MDLLSVLPELFERIYVPPAVVEEYLTDLTKPKAAVIQQALAENRFVEKAVSELKYCDRRA